MGIAVLDVGTSSMRGIFYNDKGQKKFTKQISYSPLYMGEVKVEQEPAVWDNAMAQIMCACAKEAEEEKEEIKAISLTSQRSSLIPVGEDGNPLGNAIMWQDKRNLELIDELTPYRDRIAKLTGSRPNPVFSGPKMLWMQKHEPVRYQKAMRLVVIPDYLIYQMTGSWVTDATYASRSLLMNLYSRQWDEELLALFQVEKKKLLTIIQPGSIAGKVSREWSERTGIKQGTPVVSAGGDQQCAALGMGVIKTGSIEVSAGTGAFILAASDKIPAGLRDDVICNASALPGEYILESSIPTCASVFNWLLRLCYGLNEENRELVYRQVNQEIEQSLLVGDVPFVFPFFQGRGTPDWNSSARGAIQHLSLGTSRGDLARAVLEGLVCELALNMEVLEGYIGCGDSLYLCGGLANSSVFCRILSGICQRRVCVYQDNEATAIGAFISAAVAMGLYDGYFQAFCQTREGQQVQEIQADQELIEKYSSKKEQYQELYKALYGVDRGKVR